MHRVLRRGGTLATSMYGSPDPRGAWYNELVRTYGERHVICVRYGDNRVNGKPQRLEAAMIEAGFTNVHSAIEPFEVVYADANEWWNALWTHGSRGALEQMPPDILVRFQAEALERLAQQQEPNGYHQTWQTCFTRATNPLDCYT